MGFDEFVKKKTSRFVVVKNEELKVKPRTKQEVKQAEQAGNPSSVSISSPTKKKYKSAAIEKTKKLVEKYGSKEEYFSNVNINCKVQRERNVFVAADGTVYPCCWTAHLMYDSHESPEVVQMKKLVESIGGMDKINAKIHGLEAVFESGIMRDVESTWKLKNIQEGKLIECANRCGEELDLYAEQYK